TWPALCRLPPALAVFSYDKGEHAGGPGLAPVLTSQTVAKKSGLPDGPMGRIDLHLHTTHSDGSLPPAEVLALAQKAGVTALAITDHDIVDGLPDAIDAGTRLGIEVLPGVEISSYDGKGELHILGYCLNWRGQT